MSVWKGFYVLEGIDGAGKSTQIELLKARAEKEGLAERVHFTAEPTKYGRAMLRAIRGFASPFDGETEHDVVEPATLAYIFAADRHEHVFGKDGISDSLDRGEKVFCDRYCFSSIVYQGLKGYNNLVAMLNADFPLPEILFFLDISAEEAIKRIKARGVAEDVAFERLDFLQKAEQEYKQHIANFKAIGSEMRVVILDALQPQEKIAAAIWREVWGNK